MFSLDHHRLQPGGNEILQAQDDIGQMLFSASAGMMKSCLMLDDLVSFAMITIRSCNHLSIYR